MAQRKSRLGLRLNLFVLRLTRNWLRLLAVFLIAYVSLPFIAPTLLYLGADGPARLLYTVYAPFCHQFPFRSFFLFGEQPVYPREQAATGWTPYEAYIDGLPQFEGFTPQDEFTSLDWTLTNKNFNGNEVMGYKVALCERDILIYFGLLVGTLLYSHPYVRRRLRPVPLWLYVLLGVVPIGMDGGSQLLGYPPFEFWEVRETLPEFRVLTGLVFGLMTAWLGVPYIDQSMQETRAEIEAKLARAGHAVT